MKTNKPTKQIAPASTVDFVHPFMASTETHEVLYTFSVDFMKWLLANFHPTNRPADDSRINACRDDIRNGRWFPYAGNCIRFDVKGNLIDGQHRLLAHVAENVPMLSSVIYGLPTEAIKFIDANRSRSTAHNSVVFRHHTAGTLATEDEFKNETALFRLGKWYTIGVRWMTGENNARRRISEMEMTEIVKNASVQLAFALKAASSRHTRRPGFLSALAIYFTKHPAKALEFREQMVHGVHASEAVMVLRDYLMKKSNGGDAPMYDHFNTVHAINCFHNNKPVGKLPHGTRTSWMV